MFLSVVFHRFSPLYSFLDNVSECQKGHCHPVACPIDETIPACLGYDPSDVAKASGMNGTVLPTFLDFKYLTFIACLTLSLCLTFV